MWPNSVANWWSEVGGAKHNREIVSFRSCMHLHVTTKEVCGWPCLISLLLLLLHLLLPGLDCFLSFAFFFHFDFRFLPFAFCLFVSAFCLLCSCLSSFIFCPLPFCLLSFGMRFFVFCFLSFAFQFLSFAFWLLVFVFSLSFALAERRGNDEPKNPPTSFHAFVALSPLKFISTLKYQDPGVKSKVKWNVKNVQRPKNRQKRAKYR